MEMWLRTNTEAAIGKALEILGVTVDGDLVRGASVKVWPPGSIYDRWPNSEDPFGDLNKEPFVNILAQAPLDKAWMDAGKEAFRDGAVSEGKKSENAHPDSQWTTRTMGADTASLFELSGEGNPFPIRPRMTWAV